MFEHFTFTPAEGYLLYFFGSWLYSTVWLTLFLYHRHIKSGVSKLIGNYAGFQFFVTWFVYTHNAQVLWPTKINLASNYAIVNVYAHAIPFIFSLNFAIEFCRKSPYFNIAKWVKNFCIVFTIVAMSLAFTHTDIAINMMYVLGGAGCCLLYFAITESRKYDVTIFRFLMIGWTPLMISVIIYIFAASGITREWFLSQYGFMIASGIEIMSLGAVVLRMIIMKTKDAEHRIHGIKPALRQISDSIDGLKKKLHHEPESLELIASIEKTLLHVAETLVLSSHLEKFPNQVLVKTIVAAVENKCMPQIVQTGIKYQSFVHLDDSVTCVFQDVSRALTNIVSNAIDATREYSGEKSITFDVVARDNLVQFVISNSGYGVPAELSRQIFQKGFSTKPNGSGVGLADALQVARDHRGTLKLVQNATETNFIFEIPFKD